MFAIRSTTGSSVARPLDLSRSRTARAVSAEGPVMTIRLQGFRTPMMSYKILQCAGRLKYIFPHRRPLCESCQTAQSLHPIAIHLQAPRVSALSLGPDTPFRSRGSGFRIRAFRFPFSGSLGLGIFTCGRGRRWTFGSIVLLEVCQMDPELADKRLRPLQFQLHSGVLP